MPQPESPDSYRKPCTLCHKPRDVLVRCQIDESITIPSSNSNNDQPAPPPLKPGAWHFVCPGSCWKRVSGGVIDGDLAEGREGYRYGGMWKNKHAGVSAKVPRRLKGKLGREGEGKGKGKEEENEKEGSEEGESEEGEE